MAENWRCRERRYAPAVLLGLVTINHLQPTWPNTRRVYVTYADAPCDHFTFPPNCRILLRVQDEAGHPIEGARLEGAQSRRFRPEMSDVFGRIFFSLVRLQSLKGPVVKDGYDPSHVSVKGEDDVEIKSVLHKR